MNKLLLPLIVLPLATSTGLASAPMSPGAGKTLVRAWKQSDASKKVEQAKTKSDAAKNQQGGRSYLLEEVVVVKFSGDQSEVKQRARRAVQAANSRHWQRRVESETVIDRGWYPEEAGWITPEGNPVARKLPWWVW